MAVQIMFGYVRKMVMQDIMTTFKGVQKWS